jgi:hypothetical protein
MPVAYRYLQVSGDLTMHVRFAEEIWRTHELVVPHFLFHFLTIGVVQVTGGTFNFAALVVLGFFRALTGLFIFRECARVLIPRYAAGQRLLWLAFAALLLGVGLMLMQPILKPGGPYVYQIGYFWAEPYHNPTYTALQPLALASAVSAVAFLTNPHSKLRWIAGAAAWTAAGTLAKPNFVICLVPAVIAAGAFRLWKKQPVDWKGVAFGLLLPATVILLMQFYISYSGTGPQGTYHNGIEFAPLKAFRSHSIRYLPVKLLLSVAFPVGVYVLYWRSAVRDFRLNFSFLLFAFGAGYSLVLAEKQNWQHLNFVWCAYIGLFILFVFSATFLCREMQTASWKGVGILRHGVAIALFLLHVHSGLMTEIGALTQPLFL